MENVSRITVAELLQRNRPLTGAYSFASPKPNHTSKPSTSPINLNPNPNPNPNSTSKLLPPLDHFSLIIGTLTLPSIIAAATHRCSSNTCLRFSDGSGSICCDVLDFDLRILDKKIQVLAWNFIPFKRGGGFLEIIRWRFHDSIAGISPCPNIISMALGSSTSTEEDPKARRGVFGALDSVSPLSIVSCRTGDSNSKSNEAFNSGPSTSLRCFLARIVVCECKLCSSKESLLVLEDSIRDRTTHSYTKQMFVYCCGSASSWHPVFTKLVGNIVTVTGLKKKLVFIGNEESKVMCVTTRSSALHLSRLSKRWSPKERVVRTGNGEVGTYRGIVKGVYMQGMVVELDNEVWLLLTDQLLTPPHSLRVGAIVSVRNVHFVNPTFSWTRRMLIVGSCFRTNVIVESFSPLEARCHIVSQSQSSLGKFIESLAFSSRLWVMLVASCFRKKFAGILSEKEILGSKHKGGLVEMYASSQIPLLKHQTRPGVFMEFCEHDSCAYGYEPYIDNLNLVIPLSLFVFHCERTWMRALNLENKSKNLNKEKQYSLQCEARPYIQSIRKIFSSDSIGITLIGSLKTSPTSGRLQLVDATGSIDVLVPDLPSTWDADRIFKVVEYSFIIEGVPGFVNSERLLVNDFFASRTIFDFVPLARKVNLNVCVYFRLRTPLCQNLPFHPCTEIGEDLKRFQSGTFHLLRVTHKFPVQQKFQGDLVIASSSSMFVEAIIFPWNLSVAENDCISCQANVVGDNPKNSMKSCAIGRCLENGSSKRLKVSDASGKGVSLGSVDCYCESVQKLKVCSNSYIESSENRIYSELSSHEIPCSAIISGVTHSVILYRTKAKSNSGGSCGPSGRKVLLELKSESFYKYQVLQIGCYYITKHDKEDLFCNLKGSDYFTGVKVLIPSKTHLWSLSFGSDEVCENNSSSKCLPSYESPRNDEVLSGLHNEVLLQMSLGSSSPTSFDMYLSPSSTVLSTGELQLKELKERLIKPVVTPDVIPKISSCIEHVTLSTEINCMFSEGNLISICGHVVSVHSIEDSLFDPYSNCQNLCDPLELKFFQRAANICIHVLVDHQIVKLSSSWCKRDFPVGFGPGVDATFHRILGLREQNRWMLTSVSFIVIHSIRAVTESCDVKCSSPASYMSNAAAPSILCSGLVSKLVQHVDSKPMQLHCRVVAVHFLVLERSTNVNHQLKSPLRPHLVDIPLAGFVLDDGISPCCCWANAERVATLLRLYEKFPKPDFERSGWTLKWINTGKAWSSTIYHLERILFNHHRIVVRNHGSMFDSSYQDIAVSVSTDDALSSYDENLLKHIIFNACFSKVWSIGASMMDLDAVKRLKTENLMEMEMSTHSMPHIWAEEVQIVNPLTQARNIAQELIDG